MASVLIPLAQGCEELEAVTLIDLLRRAGIEVTTAGLDERPVSCSRGVVLIPDTTLEQALAQQYDMIILPGGQPGTNNLTANLPLREALIQQVEQGKDVAAICAAPVVLAKAGLLDGLHVTSYPGALDNLTIEGMHYLDEVVVHDGNVITSRGPGTALDFALHLIDVLMGEPKRDEVEAALVRPEQHMMYEDEELEDEEH